LGWLLAKRSGELIAQVRVVGAGLCEFPTCRVEQLPQRLRAASFCVASRVRARRRRFL